MQDAIRDLRYAIFLSALVLAACAAAETPSPRLTASPTRALPADAAHQALTQVLSELDHELDQTRSLLMYLASSEEVRGDSETECATFLKPLLTTNPRYTELGVSAMNGAVVCDSSPRPASPTIAGNSYFLNTLRSHDFTVGEFEANSAAGPVFTLAYPIMEGDGARGIVFAPLSLNWLAERFATIDLPVTGEIVLLDSLGNILLRDPDAEQWFGKNIARTPLGVAMITKFRGTGNFAGADGTPRSYEFDSPRLSNHRLIMAVGIRGE